jgi:tripartite ATP-independent transporter DctM subunit
MVLVAIISKKRNYRSVRDNPLTAREIFRAVAHAALPLFLPVVIIGGIRLGVFTPTEAGAVAIVYSLFLGLLYREIKLKDVLQGIRETITSTASIMVIIGAASAFAWVLTRERIPQQLTELIISTITNKYVFLLAVNAFLLLVGMFIEGNAAMVILAPLLHPVAVAYGINEIHFAIVFIFNLALGCLTPPMGTVMFVTCSITKCKISDFIREAIPFYILLLICLLLLTFIPVLSTGIVELIY